MVAVGAFAHGHLTLGQPGQQRAHAGRADDVIGGAAVDQYRLADLAQVPDRLVPELRQRGRGPDRHPVVAEFLGAGLGDIARDARQRPEHVLEHRGEQEQLRVRGQRRVDQDQAAHRGAAGLRHAQREAAAHGQAEYEDLLAPARQPAERGVHLGEPVVTTGPGEILPGGAVPGQPREADRQAAGGQVVRPAAQRLRAAGEAVAQQHADRAA